MSPLRSRLKRSRASRLIVGLGLAVAVGFVLIGAYLIHDARRAAWRQAEQETGNLLSLLEETVSRSIRMYDLSLRSIVELVPQVDMTAVDPRVRRLLLHEPPAAEPGLGRIVLTDASGKARPGSVAPQHATDHIPALAEFNALKSGAASGLLITGPRRSRISGATILALSRRIDNRDGGFDGIALGAIQLAYFQTLVERLDTGRNGMFNLFHRDGTVIVHHPNNGQQIGRSIVGGPVHRASLTRDRGFAVGVSVLDGRERLYAFATLAGLPLGVTAAIDTASIRAAWLARALPVALLLLGLVAFTLGLTLLIERELARHMAEAASSRARNAVLSRIALTDSLTGLPNRRRYDAVLAQTWEQARRARRPVALLLVDADRFKQFNDCFGHQRGDGVLVALAACLAEHHRVPDALVARIGGEEFAAILPGADADAARLAAERMRRAVAALAIAHAPEVGGIATVSIGVAVAVPTEGTPPEDLFAQADAALYTAKHEGRNRVRMAAPPESPALAALRA